MGGIHYWACETVFIPGAAGGVGSVAVQLAVAQGACPVATASPRNHDFVRELVADQGR